MIAIGAVTSSGKVSFAEFKEKVAENVAKKNRLVSEMKQARIQEQRESWFTAENFAALVAVAGLATNNYVAAKEQAFPSSNEGFIKPRGASTTPTAEPKTAGARANGSTNNTGIVVRTQLDAQQAQQQKHQLDQQQQQRENQRIQLAQAQQRADQTRQQELQRAQDATNAKISANNARLQAASKVVLGGSLARCSAPDSMTRGVNGIPPACANSRNNTFGWGDNAADACEGARRSIITEFDAQSKNRSGCYCKENNAKVNGVDQRAVCWIAFDY